MTYPGDPSLDPSVQQRVMTAFAEAVRLFREGHPEGTRTVLRSILEIDPNFQPGQRLANALEGGGALDLGQLLGELAAAAPSDTEGALGRARAAMAGRDFQAALSLAQAVLRELPGHAEARQIALTAQQRLRAAGEIDAHIARVEETLSAGMIDEARSFLGLARGIDPTHPKLAELEHRLELAGPAAGGTGFEFEVFEHVPGPEETETAAAAEAAGAEMVVERASEEPATRAAAADFGTPPVAAKAGAAGGFSFDGTGSEGGLQFESAPAAVGMPAAGAASESADRIAALLEQGQAAFDESDWQGAIETWSRVFLIDPHNRDAEAKVEQARRCLEESDRLAEHRFYEAREAFDQGRRDDARRLAKEVLVLQPAHLEAQDLLARLDVPTAAPPPPSAPPPPPPPPVAAAAPTAADLDEELFRDDFVPARGASIEEGLGAGLEPARAGRAGVAQPRRRRALPVPLPILGAVAGLIILLVVVGMALRRGVFSSGDDAVTRALAQAEQLSQQGRLQEAITVLQSMQDQSEGEHAARLSQRLLDYRSQLKAKSAPTQTVDVEAIRQAIASGQRLKALRLIREGLNQVPGEPALLAQQVVLTEYARTLPQLADAQTGRRWETVRTLAADILKQHPDDPEVTRLWENATFNLAVTQLRKYQVASAHTLLDELVKATNDEEAARVQKFAASYLSRPTDPRYNIYVGNIELRIAD
jgi:tetratricopeptide (TPR) repeat protein